MQISSGGQGHFLTQGYEADIRAQHTLAVRCQGPAIGGCLVCVFIARSKVDQTDKEKMEITGGGSAL